MSRASLTQLDDLDTHLAELLVRRGLEPPALLELALLAAGADSDVHARNLLSIVERIEAYWRRAPATIQWPADDAPWQQAHRHLGGIVNALGKTMPVPLAAPPAGAAELRVRLRGEWLTEAAVNWQSARSFGDSLSLAAAGAESCSLHALLLDPRDGRGQIAKLTLHLKRAERAHLRFAALPASALTPCTNEFLSAMDDASTWLRSITAPVATRDLALGWDFAPVGGEIRGLHGKSVGAALALGAAWLLRAWVGGPDLRVALHRIGSVDLLDAPVSAAVQASGELGRVGGAIFKAAALRPYVQSRAWQACTVLMYVSELQDGIVGDELNEVGVYVDRCGSMADLSDRIAARHPLTSAQQTLLSALLDGDPKTDDPVNVSDLILRQVVESPVTTISDFLLHRWACWGQGTEGQLHLRFVPLQLEADPAALPLVSEVSGGKHRGLASLLKENDSLGLHAFMLRGEPGAGKSTLMQRHEQWLCRRALRRVHGREPVTGPPGERTTELPLYLPLAGLPEHADPLAWAREELRKAHPHCHELHAFLRRDPRRHVRATKLRVMLDGLNELPVPSPDRRRARAQQVVHAIWQGLGPGLPMLLGARAHHGFDFKPSIAGVPALYVVPADVLPWGDDDVRDYLRRRFPQPGKADALWDALWRQPKTLAMCRVPFNLAGQCDLLEAGVTRLMSDRADLYHRWLWQRLKRELEVQANQPNSPFYDDRLLSPEDRETLLAPGVLAQERMPPWPRAGCLLSSMFGQGLAQWRQSAASNPELPSAARGEVQVPFDNDADPKRSVVHWLDPDVRQKWLRAVQDIGLAERSIDRLGFKWRHQSWGEYLASVDLLRLPPTETAVDDRDQLFKELQPPQVERSDSEELDHILRQITERWSRVPPDFWQRLHMEGITLPRSEVVAEMFRNGYTDEDFDDPDGIWRRELRSENIVEVAGPQPSVRADLQKWGGSLAFSFPEVVPAGQMWWQFPAAWQVLVVRRLWPPFRNEVWRRLNEQLGEQEARKLREQSVRLTLPRRGDLDEVLSLAILGLPDPNPWLTELLAQGLWRRASAALPALAERSNGSSRLDQPLVQHLRRVQLVRSVGAGANVYERLIAGGVIAALDEAVPGLPASLEAHWLRERESAFQGMGHDVRERLEAGLLLGELGDNLRYERVSALTSDGGRRKGVRLRRRHWIRVGTPGQSAVFSVGTDESDRVMVSELRPFSVTLPYFEIAAYPVTVDEWRAFVDSNGYGDAEAPWWRSAGVAAQAWLRKRQAQMGDDPVRPFPFGGPGWDNPLQPVTGVTNCEALAYTAWALPLYQGDGWDDGLALTLPTELQWEAGVRGPARAGGLQQLWPHPESGGCPDALAFNHVRTRWGRPSPVGVFSAGLTTQGVADAAGNVFEWCSNARSVYPWNDLAGEQTKTPAAPEDWQTPRATRGGAYTVPVNHCRTSYLSENRPSEASVNVGLRLVRCVLPQWQQVGLPF